MSNNAPSPRQLRAALSLLDWDNKRLHEVSDVNIDTVNDVLRGKTKPRDKTMDRITGALESHGIEFMEYDGVRMRPRDIEIFRGVDGFDAFSEFLYRYLVEHGGSVCVNVSDEREFQKYRKNIKIHRSRMIDLVSRGRVSGRILAVESEFKETWAKLRRLPKTSHAHAVSFYVFGDYLALISFEHENPPHVILLQSGGFADQFRNMFDLAWESAEPI